MVRALFLALTTPAALLTLSEAGAATVTAVAAGSALTLFSIFGSIRGPAHYPPFLALLLMDSDLPHHRVLFRPFVISTLWIVVGSALIAAVPGIALMFGNEIEFQRCVPLIVGGAVFGVVVGTVLAWGQRLGRAKAWVLSRAIGAAVVATLIVPSLFIATPWGRVGTLYPSADPLETWPLLALGVLAAVAVSAARPLLEGISSVDLVDQSERWESASSAAITGDPSLALSMFRPLPSMGRSWNAVVSRLPLGVVFWGRDLVGACRTPVRFAFSTIGLIAGGAILSIAVSQAEAGWLTGAAGALVSFVSLSGLSDGLRHAAEAYSAPQLYGLSPRSLLRYHSSLPLSFGLLMMLAGSGAQVLLGSSVAGLPLSAAVSVVLFLVRVFDSAKGPLSSALLAPIPTPLGDLSGTVVLAWEADAALLVIATGALAVFGFHTAGPLALIAVVGLLAAAVTGLSVRRFRRL